MSMTEGLLFVIAIIIMEWDMDRKAMGSVGRLTRWAVLIGAVWYAH